MANFLNVEPTNVSSNGKSDGYSYFTISTTDRAVLLRASSEDEMKQWIEVSLDIIKCDCP